MPKGLGRPIQRPHKGRGASSIKVSEAQEKARRGKLKIGGTTMRAKTNKANNEYRRSKRK